MSYHAMGLGQPAAPGTSVQPCSWLQSLFGGYYAANGQYLTCAEAASVAGTVLPNSGPGGSPSLPSQYPIASIGTDPTAPAGYTAIPLGTDSSGTEQYGYSPTPQTQAENNQQSIFEQFGNLNTGGNDTGTDCSWYDTPGVINNLFNPNCGTPWGLVAFLGIAVFGLVTGFKR